MVPPEEFGQFSDIRRDLTHLSVGAAFLVFVGDYQRRSRRRVRIAKAAIARQNIASVVAVFERAILAVPIHTSPTYRDLRAPWGVAISSAGRSSKQRRRCKSSATKCQFRKDFQHNEALLGFRISLAALTHVHPGQQSWRIGAPDEGGVGNWLNNFWPDMVVD